MRKLLRTLLPLTILVLAVGLFVVPQTTHAAEGVVGTVVSLLTGGTDLFYGLVGKIFWWLLIPFGGFLLHLLGSVMDMALALSMEPSFYNSPAIGMAWGIIRDMANMVFIFVLIFEGIRTILNLGNKASVQKTITSVIIAALFLNFSLFFTKVVIDTSNVAASWFIQGITNIGGDSSSVSYSMIASLQMPNLTNASQVGDFSLQGFTKGILMFALMAVAIYVFFNVVFLIIGRIVAFIFLLITAPIGFVGALVPQLQEYSKKWWSELNNQAFMLPMFFLMVYLTLFIVDRFDQVVPASASLNTQLSNTAQADGFGPANYVIFVIIIMMLLKALETAKEYSGEIGNKVGAVVKSASAVAFSGLAAGAAFTSRIAARSTIAAMDNNAAASGKTTWQVIKNTTKENIGAPLPTAAKIWTREGRTALKDSTKSALKNSTMDVRNIGSKNADLVTPLNNILAGKTGTEFGLIDAKARKEQEKGWKETRKFQDAEISLLTNLTELTAERTALAGAQAAYAATPTPANKMAMDLANTNVQNREDAISKVFSETSNKDLEKLNKDRILTNESALGLMSADAIAHLKDKSELPEGVKSKIRAVRESPLVAAMASHNPGQIRDAIKKLSKKEIETLSSAVLTSPDIAYLASAEATDYEKFDTIIKSDAVGAGTKSRLKDIRYSTLKSLIQTPITVASIVAAPARNLASVKAELSKFKSETEVAKMGRDFLTDPRVTLTLSTQALGKISEELSEADRLVMRNTIEQTYTAFGNNIAMRAQAGNVEKLYQWVTTDNRGKNF